MQFKKKKFHLDLSIQNYGFLKFKLQICVNSEAEGKRQKLDCNAKCMLASRKVFSVYLIRQLEMKFLNWSWLTFQKLVIIFIDFLEKVKN